MYGTCSERNAEMFPMNLRNESYFRKNRRQFRQEETNANEANLYSKNLAEPQPLVSTQHDITSTIAITITIITDTILTTESTMTNTFCNKNNMQ